jgi:hypothetical protein
MKESKKGWVVEIESPMLDEDLAAGIKQFVNEECGGMDVRFLVAPAGSSVRVLRMIPPAWSAQMRSGEIWG